MTLLRKCLLLGTVAAFALTLPVLASAQGVLINEIRIDQPGGDDDEYFELVGPAGFDLAGLTYLVIGDGSTGCGTIENVTDLTGSVIPASGYFVAAEATFTLGVADLVTSLNFENSDNVTHLLVEGFTGANGDDLDLDDDGTLDITPWTAIVDDLSLVEDPAFDCAAFIEAYYSPVVVGPDGTFVPGHVFRCGTGWEIGAFDPVGGQDTPNLANSNCPVPVENRTWGQIKQQYRTIED
jgi:hypothetical protein